MFIYSKKIIQFIQEVKGIIKDVLSKEIRLKVTQNRFYDRKKMASYPIKVMIYNNKTALGYFDQNFYELGFNVCLMHVRKELLRDVIRHELAHYMTFIAHGETKEPHAPEFKAFCKEMGWGEEVYNTTFSLESSPVEESAILRKVQKLMALTSSSNKNEAELAMMKSQELLLKHHLNPKYLENEESEKIVLKRLMREKRENAKMRSIATILETFFVNIVYHRAGDFTYLEIVGDATNVEIAEYVATVLASELDKLWDQAKKGAFLKGAVAKNSFFRGLAKGYCDKIQAMKRTYSSDISDALIEIEKKLIHAKEMVYEQLSMKKSKSCYCSKSSLLGERMGKELTINPGLERRSSENPLIAYFT